MPVWRAIEEAALPTRDIIVIGSSAGGVQALRRLCGVLPADLPATILVAQHLSPTSRSILAQLLDRAGPLPASTPEDGAALERGHIYVGGPDRHILLRPGRVLMRRGPHENRTRPAANALFRSAAIAYGSRVIGVVLSGLLDDGTEGLIAIKAAGGISMVQDPADAEWPSMPNSALARDHVDHSLPIEELAAMLVKLTQEEAGPSTRLSETYLAEDRIAAHEFAVAKTDCAVTPGHPSHFSCPDCGGVLNHIVADDETRFRCQVGHAFTPFGLVSAQHDELERAIGVAVRRHRDRIALFGQMAQSARLRAFHHAEKHWERAGADAQRLLQVLENAMSALNAAPIDDAT